ncbi:TPA: ABC transporter substrate-binding protein [Mannheimia haemolytica]|uniref:ABC transporter substrate-binding protein n=2 Tax=Mannheimia haemolytica TaxID=75985 RepID=A0A547EER2_MANHA|nr:ABC transporter substrate-binding protein [Mannheimia haemolytica]AWW71229.1 ABC transporter substrate-binding protein [Pasteurellaceae bacterium 12565]AGI32349.1 ABC transporter substrate-binding protein [Mannheimia haemolytica USDA-ARS-USMARC-183]AGI35263.1 ABC transporter substrate-binding protein [Mannheimia haemolytica USDA-ARS-USMARC-185]AGK02532.1 putative ABC-type transport system, periplasmic protein [Mannheimia haemolytica M42548]AGQ24680.1 ABC transporter substrate-binding protei
MKFHKTLLVTLLSSLSVAALAQDKIQNVAITAIVEHPALDSIRKGVIEELAREGFVDGKNIKIDYQSAQGSTATAAQIARKFVGDKADIIIPITTPSAQPVVAATRSIPIVFSGVTDPVAAKLVKSWEPSGTNVTGISDHKAMAPQVKLIQTLVPDLKAVGYVYSAGEVNSAIVLEELKQEAQKQGFTIVPVAVQRSADIGTAARSLNGKVQAIYISEDNAVVSAYEALHKAALEAKIPVIAADRDTVQRGAVAAYAVNQYDIGVATGKVAARVLKGEKAGTIPIQEVSKLELSINTKTAKELGITIPEVLIKEAKQTF